MANTVRDVVRFWESPDADTPESMRVVGYVWLNGRRFLDLAFFGASREAVFTKVDAFLAREFDKWGKQLGLEVKPDAPAVIEASSEVWVIHHANRDKRQVPANSLASYLADGYEECRKNTRFKEVEQPSNKAWYHDPKTHETKRLVLAEIAEYVAKGWQKGRG